MAKITLICFRFTDGIKAYFFKGNPKNHVVAKTDETVEFTGLKFDRLRSKQLKIPYSTWCKRIGV